MFYFISIFTGALISVMILLNGILSNNFGAMPSAVMIHIVGLVTISVYMLVLRKSVITKRKIPIYYYLGGAIGILTTIFMNIAFGYIGVATLLALSLLGQSVTSLFFDEFGLLGTIKSKFNRKKLLGLAFIIVGIIVMGMGF